MKTMNLTFTDEEFRRLRKARKEVTFQSWEKFILSKCCKGVSVKHEKNIDGRKRK